nr:hypothetical protein [Tanacetum cinerariifolium]
MGKNSEKNAVARKLAASMVRENDGKIVGKDGKPLRMDIHYSNYVNPKSGQSLNGKPKTGIANPISGGSVLNGENANPNLNNVSRKVDTTQPVIGTSVLEGMKTGNTSTLTGENNTRLGNETQIVGNIWGTTEVNENHEAYSEDGLSLIGMQIGKPVMLDAFSSSMCTEVWGRMSFARALIEVDAYRNLKEEVVMAVPRLEGEGHTIETMKVEYEWKPPRCSDCLVFGHNNNECPKRVVEIPKETIEASNGFTMVQNRRKKGKNVANGVPKVNEGNDQKERRLLWHNLGVYHSMVNGMPWTLLGDFNVAYNIEDNLTGGSAMTSAMCEFKDCVEQIEKMKMLKKPLRKLLHSHGNLHDRVNKLRVELDAVQKALDQDPHNSTLREEKAVLFHKTIKGKNQRSCIEIIRNANNIEFTGSPVADYFVEHYMAFLGVNEPCNNLDPTDLFTKHVSDNSCAKMIRPVTNEEVKRAMFDIGDDKSPGPDGYSSLFFKESWDTVGEDVCRAVRDFFRNRKILKEINHTLLVLVPKVAAPMKINDYRPISCYNVIYKCISKINTNRIIDGVGEVVSENQSAFIPGRRISDNILITQELMHNYHRNTGALWCAFKVDIQKAYDTVDWRFLECILKYFGFPLVMINWIMVCVTSASFSINVNGNVHGFFNGKRGLRQGDPISPTCLQCYGEEKLPVKYLGVPLISSRLLNKYCKILVEKVQNRIGDWKNKSLSFAGRLQLCQSVISSMHVYWASVLVIPVGIIHDIEQLMRGFLWCNRELKKGRAKVAWADICLLKCEGGLGLRSLEVFNIALMTTHLWNIPSNKQSLWVRWIHTYKLRGKTIWEVQPRGDMSWGWQKIL